jgi:serine/threonine protein phosphatase 1
MQTLIVGDIHGCYAEFRELLERAGLGPDDAIVAIGDIVDRGPDTPGVVEFFQHRPRAASILGNHERKHIRAARGQLQPALSQLISRSQLGPRYPAALRLMESFPNWLELPEALLVHGFWEPGLPVTEQKENVLTGVTSGEAHLKARGLWPWFERYDGPKPLVVGHRDYLGNGQPLIVRDRVWAIDTACVRGGRLTGLLLPAFKLVSVAARDNHWLTVSQGFRQIQTPPEVPPWDPAANARLETLMAHIFHRQAELEASLAASQGWADLPPGEQDRRYAQAAAGTPLAPWLGRARQGALNLEALRGHFWHPEQADVFMEELGLRPLMDLD